jgi:hypothetical protein
VAVSFNRYAKRPDKTTKAIVDGLRTRGYVVEYIDRPTDIAVTHARFGKNVWKFLECKSRKLKNGEVVLDKRQKEQREFCAKHGVPYVTDVFEALLALGEVVSL